jgi:hypothetical protein
MSIIEMSWSAGSSAFLAGAAGFLGGFYCCFYLAGLGSACLTSSVGTAAGVGVGYFSAALASPPLLSSLAAALAA